MTKVGDYVWVFDQNRRIYERGPDGRALGPPLFREHFRPVQIVGETAKSWILAGGDKVPRSGGDVRHHKNGRYPAIPVYMTRGAVDAAVFRHDHKYKISMAVEKCDDIDVLRQVAALVGYKGVAEV